MIKTLKAFALNDMFLFLEKKLKIFMNKLELFFSNCQTIQLLSMFKMLFWILYFFNIC